GADIIVPGVHPGPALQIDRRKGVWIASPANEARVRFDGRVMAGQRDLRRQDVLAVGDAQIIVTGVSRTLLRLDVCHLVGNTTISPAGTVSAMAPADGDEELLIQSPSVVPSAGAAQAAREQGSGARKSPVQAPRPISWLRTAALAIAVAVVIALFFEL